ncbi:hypothetical protein SESBI_17869 [Sesbania bispinosa]|nr:hypothetical protein SESBI_17869 [Sesbania bispinosa]
MSHQGYKTIDQRRVMKTSGGGEIVEVDGGHIIRPIGRKDRHSKVYTSKGPRDRRVRLSAHTAIEFYDVQDRLGYDRPSKAVDWLIKKAKPSIDQLAELPPWNLSATTQIPEESEEYQQNNAAGGLTGNGMLIGEPSQSSAADYNFQLQMQLGDNSNQQQQGNAFVSPHVDPTDPPIAFFPTNSATSSSINFHTCPPDIIPRPDISTENLGLSLHLFQDHPGFIPWQSHQQGETENHAVPSNEQQTLFAGLTPVGFENNYQRMVTWNNETTTDHVNKVGFMVNPPPYLGSGSSEYSPSGTLQSSFSPSFRSWGDFPMASSELHRSQPVHQAIFGSRFLSQGFVGFDIPERIQAEEQREKNHGVASNRPSSYSPTHN